MTDPAAPSPAELIDAMLGRLAPQALSALKILAAPHWVPPNAVFLQLRQDVLRDLPALIEGDLVRISSAGRLYVSESLRDLLRARSSPEEIEATARRWAALFGAGTDAESRIEAYYHELFVDPVDASRRIFRSMLEWASEPFFAHHLVQRLMAVWREAHEQRPLPDAAAAYLTFTALMGQSAAPERDAALLDELDPGEDRFFAAQLLLKQASVLTLLNRLPDAQLCLSRAYVYFEEAADAPGMSQAYRLLGRIAAKRDAYATATSLYQHALKLAQGAGRKILTAQALQALADVASLKGDFAEAAKRYEEAIAALAGIGGRTAEANARNTYSQVLTATGKFELAKEHVRLAAETFETLEHSLGRANSLRARAQIEIEAGELPAAEKDLREARSLYQKLGTRTGWAGGTEMMGQVRQLGGDRDAAEAHYGEAQAAFAAIDDRFGVATCLRDRGVLALERGDKTAAAKLLSEAAARFEEIGAKAEGAAATLLLWLADGNADPEPAARTLVDAGAILPRAYHRAWSESPKTAGRGLSWAAALPGAQE